MSEGKTILICTGPSCLSKHSMGIVNEFNNRIEEYGLDVDILPTLKATGCQGLCEKGPLIRILPNDVLYCGVKIKDVEEIIQKTILEDTVVDRLLYYDPESHKRVTSMKDAGFYKRQTKIALRNVGEIDPLSIDDYISRGGYTALRKVLFNMKPDEVIAEVENSGLRGRGGAGFPTGTKWRQCANVNNLPKYVVCDGDEGDPGAFMDRSIMEGDPHSIVEGMIIGAYATGAEHGFMYIRDEYFLTVKNVDAALREAREKGFLGKIV